MDEYEQRAWDELQKRRAKHLSHSPRNLVPKAVRNRSAIAGRLVAERAQELPGAGTMQELLEGVAQGAGGVVARIARDSLQTGRVLAAYEKRVDVPVTTISDIRSLSLRDVDAVLPHLDLPYMLAGATSGATAGFMISGGELMALIGAAGGGSIGVAPGAGVGAAPGVGTVVTAMAGDAAATALASLRLVYHTAAYYGYDVTRPEERLRALAVLNAASARDQLTKQAAYRELNKVVRLIVRNATWKQLDESVITKIMHKIFGALIERLTKARLGAALPVAGVVIGATLNARTLGRVADGAGDLYREQFLRDKHGLALPEDDPATATGRDVIDIPLADIIEEEIGNAALVADALAEFVLQFDPAEIGSLAARFGYADDSAATAAGAAARERGSYTADELALVCGWKTPRSAPLVAQNGSADIETITARALDGVVSEHERMASLLELRGVGVPSASALLHFAFPDRYPILDVRALESLGKAGRSTYSVGFWLRYLVACRALAAKEGVAMRTLDKALWQHSKEQADAA
jgi:hypothetical protein